MRQAKPGVVFVAAIIALTGIGFGYAHWTETLTLTGTVETGELELEWSCECWDNDDELKDIGKITCSIEEDTLTITVTNAYPCYEVGGTIDIENAGTVPAVLTGYEIVPPDDVTYEYNSDTGEITLYYEGDVMATGSITFGGDSLEQIDNVAYIYFTIHFTNPGLPENWEGTFQVTLNFENWSPPPQ